MKPNEGDGESRAYMITRKKVPLAQYDYVAGLTRGLNDDTRRFFCHVLLCSPWRLLKHEGWVPVTTRTIRKYTRKCDVEALRQRNLIEVRDHNRLRHQCRRFKIPLHVAEAFAALAPATCLSNSTLKKVDLFSWKPTTRKEKSSVTQKNNRSEPPLIRKALKVITKSFFDAETIEMHLARLGRIRDVAQQSWLAAGAPDDLGDPTLKAYTKARARYINDSMCFQVVLDQDPVYVGNGIWSYKPAYEVQRNGRIGQIHGGLQSCSREMKYAAYQRIEGLLNYDLKSSQPSILIQFLERAGIDASWLRAYVSEPGAKHRYAQQIGISVDAWKTIFCALLMSATLPKKPRKSKGSIVKALREEVGDEKLQEVYDRLIAVVAPLKQALDAWHAYLSAEYVRRHGKRLNVNGKTYLTNDAGKTRCVEAIPGHRRGAVLAAFLLQGLEAAFIHTLTAKSREYGFQVLGNEHDGLITIGEIPEEAVLHAAQEVNLFNARMEVKPFEAPADDFEGLEVFCREEGDQGRQKGGPGKEERGGGTEGEEEDRSRNPHTVTTSDRLVGEERRPRYHERRYHRPKRVQKSSHRDWTRASGPPVRRLSAARVSVDRKRLPSTIVKKYPA